MRAGRSKVGYASVGTPVWTTSLEGPGASRTPNRVLPNLARFTLEGSHGRAFITIPLDEHGSVAGISIDRESFEGIGNLVLTCPDDRREEMAAFYGALLGEDRWRIPRLVFDEGRDYRPPLWGDPERPTQVHCDILVSDLEATGAVVLAHGAEPLQAFDEHRTYADPIGHPFCLYPDGAGEPVLGRIVLDCPNPRVLAPFYEALLRMPSRFEDSGDRVVIGRADGALPMLGFQRVSPYVAPRWPDPKFPPQMHFDMKFDDRTAAASLVEKLGGSLVPPQGGSCPVYTDPVGHPFCLCMHGE